MESASCSVYRCERSAYSKGLCEAHYRRHLRTGTVNASRAIGAEVEPRPCVVCGCANPTTERGLCHGHYLRLIRLGHVEAEERHLTAGKTPYAEHRLVMARYLGRPMLPDESAHHLNGDRLHNRIENLELWTCSQPSGQRVSDRVACAIEILRQYRPEALAAPPPG